MQWRMRLWGYLGHVLRRPPQHPARKLLLGMASLHRPQGGFPNSPLHWLLRTASAAYGEDVQVAMVLAKAADRECWRETGRRHFHSISLAEMHSHLHAGLWKRWQHSILQHVSWLFNVVVLFTGSQLRIVWVDTEEGLVAWDIDDMCSGIWQFFHYARMRYPFWVFEISMTETLYECYPGVVGLASRALEEYHQVWSVSVVSDEHIERVREIS